MEGLIVPPVSAHRLKEFDPDGTPSSKYNRDERLGQHCQGNTGDSRLIAWGNSKHTSLNAAAQRKSCPGSPCNSGNYKLQD